MQENFPTLHTNLGWIPCWLSPLPYPILECGTKVKLLCFVLFDHLQNKFSQLYILDKSHVIFHSQ